MESNEQGSAICNVNRREMSNWNGYGSVGLAKRSII